VVIEEMQEPITSSPVCNFYTERIGQRNSGNPHPRPLKVYFSNLAERNSVWKARSRLTGSPFAVNEDLPLAVRIQRAELRNQRFAEFNGPPLPNPTSTTESSLSPSSTLAKRHQSKSPLT